MDSGPAHLNAFDNRKMKRSLGRPKRHRFDLYLILRSSSSLCAQGNIPVHYRLIFVHREAAVVPAINIPISSREMAFEEGKDPLKDVEWKSMGSEATKETDTGTITKKRLPKKMRQIPEYYFLPRRSLPSAMAFYGSFIVAGVGAGMLLELWINKKVKEDGGVIWEFGKKYIKRR
ncbi:hypothetical protein V2J09_013939 [Rumex salicifolius]